MANQIQIVSDQLPLFIVFVPKETGWWSARFRLIEITLLPILSLRELIKSGSNNTRILHAISPPWLNLSHVIWFLKGHFKPRMNMHFMILFLDGNIHLYRPQRGSRQNQTAAL